MYATIYTCSNAAPKFQCLCDFGKEATQIARYIYIHTDILNMGFIVLYKQLDIKC